MVNLTAADVLQHGVAVHKEGKLQEAQRIYRAILKSQPKQSRSSSDLEIIAQAYSNLGVAQQQLGDLDPAIENYKQAINIQPDNIAIYFNLAQAQQDKGDIDDSIESYTKAVTIQPENVDALSNLGSALLLKGEIRSAIKRFKKAVELKPDAIELYFKMAQALRDLGDLKASIDCYKKAVELSPGDGDALNNLGAAQQHNGEPEAAIASYLQALEINPNCAETYNNMGIAQHEKGDLDEAIACFKKALDIKSDYDNAYNNMGHVLHDKGDLEAAIGCYEKALKIAPDSVQALNNLGNALRETGEYERAIVHFEQLNKIESKPGFSVNPFQSLFWLNSKSQTLECLYILGRYSEFSERLEALAECGDINLRVAGVSAFVNHQLKREDSYPFCTRPLDFMTVGNLDEHLEDVDGFVEDLIQEGSKENQIWEPRHGVTKFGFQTSPTIFQAGENCGALEKILRREIASYYSKFQHEDCGLINSWPEDYDLRGWFVRLLKNGHQQSHNHPAGWLSGVIYLKTIDSQDSDDGSIELSLHGHDLPILDNSYARKIHRPKRGDIILFPSSLYHRTIPFSQDTDRCVIAFDMNRYAH